MIPSSFVDFSTLAGGDLARAEYAAARNAEDFLGDYREVEPVRGGQLKWSEG